MIELRLFIGMLALDLKTDPLDDTRHVGSNFRQKEQNILEAVTKLSEQMYETP
jgi:hypothetical protein